jgi:hypothetical protein
MNRQAVTLLQEIYGLVRDDSTVSTQQPMSQYRSALLKEISARIKTAIGVEAKAPAQVQARAAVEGMLIEIGCFDANGELQNLKPLTTDQAHGLIREIEQSISEVVTREFASLNTDISPRTR